MAACRSIAASLDRMPAPIPKCRLQQWGRTKRKLGNALAKPFGRGQCEVSTACAEAERDDQARSIWNASGKTPEEYALALWRDGDIKG